jgi:hypothetical protein
LLRPPYLSFAGGRLRWWRRAWRLGWFPILGQRGSGIQLQYTTYSRRVN